MVQRIEHYGAAVPTVLSSPLSSTGVTFDIQDATGWPTGAIGQFYVTLDAGQTGEERILCASRSGQTITVATSGRGVDGTTATAHSANAAVIHSYSATEADQANAHQVATSGVHGVTGAVVGTTDTQTLTGKTIDGGNNTLQNIPAAAMAAEAWTAYTPTFGNCTSPSGNFYYSLNGKSLKVRGQFSGGTATAAGDVTVSLPSGYAGRGSDTQVVPALFGAPVASGYLVGGSGTIHLFQNASATSFSAGQALANLRFSCTVEVP